MAFSSPIGMAAPLDASLALDEDDFKKRLARADSDAVRRVYDAHHVRIRAFARRVLGDAEAAEDVVQEVFVALPKAIQRFRGDASLSSYLLGIAARRCHKHRRAAARRGRAMDRLRLEAPSASVSDPESAAREARLVQALHRGLTTLSLKHRVVFVLMSVEERTSPEVAEILGIPEGTVRTRLHHAKKRLREFFEREAWA